MIAARFHQDPQSGGGPPPPRPQHPRQSLGGWPDPANPSNSPRLNLLLSCAHQWQPSSWIDNLPRMLQPMGVRSLSATTGKQATQVLQAYQIHIALVDLDLPLDDSTDPASAEPSGSRLLNILARLDQPPPTVVIKRQRTHRDDSREINHALRSGAFAVIDPPRTNKDLEILLEVLKRCMSRHYKGLWPTL